MEQGGAESRVGALEEGRRETGLACPYPNLEEKFLIFEVIYNLRILQLYMLHIMTVMCIITNAISGSDSAAFQILASSLL